MSLTDSPPSQGYSADWVRSLSPAQREELARLLEPRLTKYIPHRPHPTQAAFLLLPGREALFGGAAGGGKSDALLMAALQYVDVPGYAAILFRRTFPDLNQAGALIPRSKEWLAGTDASWNGQDHQWTFPSGAVLKFGHLQHEDDKYAYQGSEYHFVGFDELTQFTETQYSYLLSRVRRKEGFPVPLRTRASANPGGVGHEWVKQRFLVEGRQAGRVFVPSKLADNPSLDASEYRKQLAELDTVTRRQLEDGDWDIRARGPLFDRAWFRVVDAPPAEALRKGRRCWYWDFAASEPSREYPDPDWTVGVLLLEYRGEYWVLDVRRFRKRPAGVEAEVKAAAQVTGPDVDVWVEQEPGSAGVASVERYAREVLKGFTVRGNRETGSKEDRARPVSSAAEQGRVHLVRGTWVSAFLDEVHVFPQKGVHDDQVDALSGAFRKVSVGVDFKVHADAVPVKRTGLLALDS